MNNMFSLYLSFIPGMSELSIGGYDRDFLRILNGNQLLSNKEVDDLVNWVHVG
jgi:hypothetical protein